MTDRLPLPALYASHAGIWLADADGASRRIDRPAAIAALAATPHLVLNAVLTGQRLGAGELPCLDLLELFAFVHPARFCVPTPAGLARALGQPLAGAEADVAATLGPLAAALLAVVADPVWPQRGGAWGSVRGLARHRWAWAGMVMDRLPPDDTPGGWLFSRLPEWDETAPPPPPRTVVLDDGAVLDQLTRLVGDTAEPRPGQRDYALAAAAMFAARPRTGAPRLVIAEAGTGIGKTLGYLAPASLWTASAGGQVTVSTYTKALQRQLAREARRAASAHQASAGGNDAVVVRKGRENYLCLLNLEDALQGGFAGRAAMLAYLVARWALYTRDGDMVGGDLPGWLPGLFRRSGHSALTDRRGECVYAGCPHYRKCFIEHNQRAAAHARIVIANHALTMVQAVRQRPGTPAADRLIFDEGHHLFDAADASFAVALTGQELIELRRWLIGPETKARGRRRGLAARLADVASYDSAAEAAIHASVAAAAALPADGWLTRIDPAAAEPSGPLEQLLAAAAAMVFARAPASGDGGGGYGLETDLVDPDPALVGAAAAAADALSLIVRPLTRLAQRLEELVETPPDWLDGQARARVDGARASLGLRCDTLNAWAALLGRVGGPVDPLFVDWLAVERFDGRLFDCGLHRRWLNPAEPLARLVFAPAHGVMVTSATLRAGGDWDQADARCGAAYLGVTPTHHAIPSPFDYARQAEVLIVTDIARGDPAALAGAYGRLIVAAGGGTLGLFGAIRRLRQVHAGIADHLARLGHPLYAQHVDPLEPGTLVDIFRDDPRAALLGTDALRDGVDVPGEALRLVVMEGVPWPRPTLLHAARRLVGGGSAYDDAVVRARLAQAFGRLIRRGSDVGQFVLLSAAVPSRLLSAFPAGTPVRRVTLDAAAAQVAAWQSAAKSRPPARQMAENPPFPPQ